MWVVASPPRRRGPHRQGDDVGVYTDRWKWPLDVVLGHLCTLLGRGLGLWVALGSQQCTQMGGSGLSAPDWGICVHCWASRGSCERPWGRSSVHRSAKMAPRSRFGAFVYTVATRVAIRIATRAACVRWHECPSRHGVPAAPPRWPLPLGREDRL